jgi:hypothetical protein
VGVSPGKLLLLIYLSIPVCNCAINYTSMLVWLFTFCPASFGEVNDAKRWIDCVKDEMRIKRVSMEMTSDRSEWKKKTCMPIPLSGIRR